MWYSTIKDRGNMKVIEIAMPVIGERITSDHGYKLYSALCKIAPEIHEIEKISICGISGIPDKFRTLHLTKSI